MTDPTPNAPVPTPLSPAAQAVLDAAFSVYDCEALYSLTEEQHASMIVVAALCAVADQAIPMTKTPWGSTLVPVLTAQESRERILDIATELENQP